MASRAIETSTELDHQAAEGEQLHCLRALRRLARREWLDAVDVEVELIRAEPLDQGCELIGVGVGKGLQLEVGLAVLVVRDGLQGRRRGRYEKVSAATRLVDAVCPALVEPPTA